MNWLELGTSVRTEEPQVTLKRIRGLRERVGFQLVAKLCQLSPVQGATAEAIPADTIILNS